MVKIKICGITNLKDALKISKLRPDALGFVFYKKSPRYIAPDEAKEIIHHTPSVIKKVGVFVNAKGKDIKNIAQDLKLDMLQFHGDESPKFCARFKHYKIIKAFRIKEEKSLKDLKHYSVWGFLLDSYNKNLFGGSGKTFRWQMVRKTKLPGKNLFLSGGLDVKNIGRAIKLIKPNWVDVSSSVESSPGKKDYQKVKNFIEVVRGKIKQ